MSEWANANLRLSPEDSAEPGQYSTSRAPYQAGIMDACSDAAVETTFMKAVIAFHVDQDPAPMLLLNPTLEMSETFSKDRLAPMVRDTQMRDILRDRPYYGVSTQSGYSTDILFKTRQDLLYHNYFSHSTLCFGAK